MTGPTSALMLAHPPADCEDKEIRLPITTSEKDITSLTSSLHFALDKLVIGFRIETRTLAKMHRLEYVDKTGLM
jgi:hypothetical protein